MKTFPTEQDILDVMQLYWDEFPASYAEERTKRVLARLQGLKDQIARNRTEKATEEFSKRLATPLPAPIE